MDKKTKLIWQIFPSFLMITLVSLAAVTSYSTNYFKKFFLKNSEKELTIRAKLLQKQFADILKGGPRIGYIDKQCKDIGKRTGTRVTVILPSGVVAGDSFGNIKIMENHMKRPEIMEALKRKKGVSVRYSSTLDKNMMYVAVPVLRDGEVIGVVRTALPLAEMEQMFDQMQHRIIWGGLAILLLAALFSLVIYIQEILNMLILTVLMVNQMVK